MKIAIGQTLLDRYRVDAFIAAGNMGAVYRVWDLKRSVPLAMKLLHTEFADDPSILRSFQREARALQKLSHPHIVPFYGLEHLGQLTFLLQRFIDGFSLSQVLASQSDKRLPPNEALIYLKAACSALGYAHSSGVVHCDVKPGNMMVDQGGNIYLTDFGIARHADSTTTTIAGAGTPAYMAPEQIQVQAVSPATDVYALGVMLFEMLTGRRPFLGSEEGSETAGPTKSERVRYAHRFLNPPDPCKINPSLPVAITAVLEKAMAKDPSARYSDTMALFEATCAAFSINTHNVPDLTMVELPAEPIPSPVYPGSGITGVVEDDRQKSALGTFLSSGLLSFRNLVILGVFLVFLGAMLIINIDRDPVPGISPTTVQETTAVALLTRQAGETQVTTSNPGTTPTSVSTTPTVTLNPSPTPTTLPTLTPSPTPTQIQAIITTNPKDGAELVYVKAGTFMMGSDPSNDPDHWGAEGPSHKVILSNDFWIYRTEVTNGMYKLCQADQACPLPKQLRSETRPDYYENPQYDNYPVVFVTYNNALSYCRWSGGRLPTEAEWELAARGTDERLFPWGNEPVRDDHANICDRNCSGTERETHLDDGFRDTSPVGNFPAGASPYGALDMAGNVWEWVQDWFSATYYQISPMEDPIGPAGGERRVMRGGSWFNGITGIRTVVRSSRRPSDSLASIGFRCVVDVP